MKRYNLARGQRSQVLVTVLIVLAIVLTLGAGLLFHSRSFRDVANLQRDTGKAYSLAKSGISMGESLIDMDPCNPTAITMDETYTLGEGTIGIGITSTLDTAGEDYVLSGDITSTGKADSSVRVLEKTFNLSAPAPEGWARAYGGSGGDVLNVIQQSSDEYILGGRTRSFGVNSVDFLILKTDLSGNAQWARTYGGMGLDILYYLQETTDGGYILGGNTESFGAPNYNFLVIKTDSDGNVGAAAEGITWAKTYAGSNVDTFSSLQQTSDGYILGGTTYSFGVGGSDFLIIKTDSNGTMDWARTYGGSVVSGRDHLDSLRQTADVGYILAGDTESFSSSRDCLLIKIDSFGVPEWARTYGGSGLDDVHTFQKTLGGGYILGGSTESFSATRDYLVINTDSSGNIQWAKTYGVTDTDSLEWFQESADGYILGGHTQGPSYNFLIIKTDASGNVGSLYPGTWAKIYGDSANDIFSSLLQSADGYILGGYSDSFSINYDFFLIKSDLLGDLDCCNIYSDAISSLTIQEYTNDGNDTNDDFTLTIQEYTSDGNDTNDDFTLTIQEYNKKGKQGFVPDEQVVASLLNIKRYNDGPGDDFTPTTTPVCPSP